MSQSTGAAADPKLIWWDRFERRAKEVQVCIDTDSEESDMLILRIPEVSVADLIGEKGINIKRFHLMPQWYQQGEQVLRWRVTSEYDDSPILPRERVAQRTAAGDDAYVKIQGPSHLVVEAAMIIQARVLFVLREKVESGKVKVVGKPGGKAFSYLQLHPLVQERMASH